LRRKNILLTGRPGVGKTTLIWKIVDELKRKGIKIGGFYTEEIRKEGSRVGFKIVSLDGREGLLAHIDCESKVRVGKYKVNLKDIEGILVPLLEEAQKECKIIIIDEIGKMEVCSPLFRKAIFKCLDSDRIVLATLSQGRAPFFDQIRQRRDILLLEVTEKNQGKILSEILRLLLPNPSGNSASGGFV